MGKIFYISDAHVAHRNILRLDNRPFKTIEENDQAIMDNWNSVVTNDDLVVSVGDMHWGKDDAVYQYARQLNGRKIAIRGNHTIKKPSKKLRDLFEDWCDYKEITDNGKHIILCHYPILLHKAAYNPDCYMICGHVHTTRENDFLEKWSKELRDSRTESGHAYGNIINVGAMMPWMGYTPRTLDEILEAKGWK